jgi:hypothetical protein
MEMNVQLMIPYQLAGATVASMVCHSMISYTNFQKQVLLGNDIIRWENLHSEPPMHCFCTPVSADMVDQFHRLAEEQTKYM